MAPTFFIWLMITKQKHITSRFVQKQIESPRNPQPFPHIPPIAADRLTLPLEPLPVPSTLEEVAALGLRSFQNILVGGFNMF